MAAHMVRRRLASAVLPLGAATAITTGYLSVQPRTLHLEEQSKKLPIYSSAPEPVVLTEVRGPLEEQVASARRSVLEATHSVRHSIRGQVDRWIGVENAVENKVSSLIPDDEPITPGILYVGVSTLAGSIFTRYRSLPLRILTPPILFTLSLNYFLPKTAHNLSGYYLELEAQHLPPFVRQQRESLIQSWNKTRSAADEQLHKAREGGGSLVQRGLQSVEQGTGLKVAGSNKEPLQGRDSRLV